MKRKSFGIIGGLGPLASADIFYKIVRYTPAETDQEHFDIVFEQHPFDERQAYSEGIFNPTARKLYVFNMIKAFEDKQVDAVILPCFISHTFIAELVPEIKLAVINMMKSLQDCLCQQHPEKKALGILTSDYVRSKGLFEDYFNPTDYRLIYPEAGMQGLLTKAIYGSEGIKAGQPFDKALNRLRKVCQHLIEQGAELLLPGFTEIPAVVDSLHTDGLPLLDSNRIYAEYAIQCTQDAVEYNHRIGIVGGVGPAATVDFMQKIVKHTEANRDQDHVKLVVHHNPQIPDRTEFLIGSGSDPTIQLFAACRQLEKDEVDFIAIPCNTAHAFVDRLQRYLSVPIVNMLTETVSYIERHHQDIQNIGLLATTGTLQSKVYHEVFATTDFCLTEPDEGHQQLVMKAIYGDYGVKSGHTRGQCQDDFLQAVHHLAQRGAQAVILGCTELPLLLNQDLPLAKLAVVPVLLDPTDILAQRCVQLITLLSLKSD